MKIVAIAAALVLASANVQAQDLASSAEAKSEPSAAIDDAGAQVQPAPATTAPDTPAPATTASDTPAPEATTETTPEAEVADGGKIIIFRPSSVLGFGIACPVRYRGQEIVELGRGKYAEWAVPAGSYILGNKTASVEVNVAAGQTKYVRCQIKTGFLTGRADLQIVDHEAFAEHQADFARKEITLPDLASR